MGLFSFKKNKRITESIHEKSQIIGIYKIPNYNDVKLIELLIEEPINEFDPGQITQQQKGQDRLNWQTAYDEKYLDLSGNKIVGDDFDRPQDMDKFRVAFFFHYIDTSKPLISQYGLINLREATDLPERLSGIINYEPID